MRIIHLSRAKRLELLEKKILPMSGVHGVWTFEKWGALTEDQRKEMDPLRRGDGGVLVVPGLLDEKQWAIAASRWEGVKWDKFPVEYQEPVDEPETAVMSRFRN